MAAAIPGDSFTFNTINSLMAWGIKVISYDVFSAPKRDRRQKIPFRHGSYDYGEKYYDEKIVRLDCCTETRALSKADMREVIYWLTQRGRLTLWDEPDKHYIGELLDSADVQVLPKYVKQQFTLSLKCEPFAYRDQVTQPITSGSNAITYNGTAETPTLIILKNNTDAPISNILLKLVYRRKS